MELKSLYGRIRGVETMNKIEKFVGIVAEDLQIPIPEIRYKAKLQTDTMLAMADVNNGILILKKNLTDNLDVFFVIAHEMRHLWQAQTDRKFYFTDYRTAAECGDVDIYNSQPAEMDANAYAVTIMEDFFNVTPQFNGLAKEGKDIIYHLASLM